MANGWAEVIRQRTIGEPSVTLVLKVTPNSEYSSMTFEMKLRRQALVSVSGDESSWQFTVNASDLRLPVAVDTTMSFEVNPSDRMIMGFAVRGECQTRG